MIEKIIIIDVMIIFVVIINSINGSNDSCYDNDDIDSDYHMLIGDESAWVVTITNGYGNGMMIIILMIKVYESYNDILIKWWLYW